MSYKPYDDIEIPKDYGPAARQAIATDIIDHIIKRSLNGQDVDNKSFPAYSASYAGGIDPKTGIKHKPSLDFKNAGKSKGKVNLKLSFEMLNSLHLRNHSNGNLRIGVYGANAKKAEGNETGSYGGSPNSKKERKFIGISKDDLKVILAKYPTKDKNLLKGIVAEATAVREAAEEITEEIRESRS